jgi:hypothetical protein
MNYVDPKLQARRTQIVEVLEMVCESLELSTSQFAQAKHRYEGVGACLAGSDDPVLRAMTIYLQGSTALRTTVRPIGFNEHDVDLIAHVPDPNVEISPAIGVCLRANGNYAPLLEEMPRCWRLSYANEFHMGITPSIPNPNCRFGGELVPDKTLKTWKASNPKGYKRLFDQRAKLAPVIRLRKHVAVDSARASVEPYPDAGGFKGILRRPFLFGIRAGDTSRTRAQEADRGICDIYCPPVSDFGRALAAVCAGRFTSNTNPIAHWRHCHPSAQDDQQRRTACHGQQTRYSPRPSHNIPQ